MQQFLSVKSKWWDYALVLDEMAPGLTAGQYIAVVINNLSKSRTVESRSFKPYVSLSDIITHQEKYGRDNGWRPHDAQRSLTKLFNALEGSDPPLVKLDLEKLDLEKCPFESNKLFIHYGRVLTHKLVLIKKDKTGYEYNKDEPYSGAIALYATWLADRIEVLSELPPIWEKTLRYVKFISSQTPEEYSSYLNQPYSRQVVAVNRISNRPVLPARALHRVFYTDGQYSVRENAVIAMALGYAWAMNFASYTRIETLIEHSGLHTSHPMESILTKSQKWINSRLVKMLDKPRSLQEEIENSFDMNKLKLYQMNTAMVAHAYKSPRIAKELYKCVLARETKKVWDEKNSFKSIYSAGRFTAFHQLLDVIEKEEKQALFKDFIQLMADRSNYQDDVRWQSWAENLQLHRRFNSNVDEDEAQEISDSQCLVNWLSLFDLPCQKDLDMLLSLDVDVNTLGNWLQNNYEKKLSDISQNMLELPSL